MLKVFNTLGRELEEFIPIKKGEVKMYQCGPTVYWTQHIGNMRAMTLGDLIRRSLIYLGYDVKFIRNYTDFGHLTGDNIGDADIGEDRMEKAAKREGITPDKIADKYIKEFEGDVQNLNLIPPTVTARATDYIQQMIEMVKTLLDKSFAYITDDAIYFDTSKFTDYTKLSGQNLSMNKEGEGHGEITDTNKKNPTDFAIWFFRTGPHANALQYWESPFTSSKVEKGYGFPGWHIECSAMVKKNLGDTIDIHMGGIEHISIHHTNEIAQSEAANEVKYVNYWIHNEHLTVDGGKMSKSLGNVYNLSSLLEKGYDPIILRYFFLQSHYRSKQNFTFQALDSAKTAYERLINFLKTWLKESGGVRHPDFKVDDNYKQQFVAALEDDFNIPQALAVVWDLTKSDLPSTTKLDTILDFDRVLGLRFEEKLTNPEQYEIPIEAKVLIDEREVARLKKDWKKADEIREELRIKYNIDVKDTSEGQEINQIKA